MNKSMAKSIIYALVILVALASFTAVAQSTEASERIAQLAEGTSLLRDGMKPWHLSMTFNLYNLEGKLKESGTVEEWWVSPKQRRLVITSPSFNQTIPYGATEVPDTVNRESYLIHNLIEQVISPIPHFSKKDALSVSEAPKIFGKVKLSCLSVSRKLPIKGNSLFSPGPVFCLDPDSDILRTLVDSDQEKVVIRSRLGRFRDIYVGLDNTVKYGDKVAIEGKVVTLQSYDPQTDPVELTEANNSPAAVPAIVMAGKFLKKTQPIYPDYAKQRHLGGTVVLSGLVSREGNIQSLDVISTPDFILSQAALDAVRQWQYQPLLINGQPTMVSTIITVHFNR
jgi:TonB family protein